MILPWVPARISALRISTQTSASVCMPVLRSSLLYSCPCSTTTSPSHSTVLPKIKSKSSPCLAGVQGTTIARRFFASQRSAKTMMRFSDPSSAAGGDGGSSSQSTETVMMDLCIVPIGGPHGLSVSQEVSKVEQILRDPKYKLVCKLHAYGTNIQGDWDNVMAAMKECHRALHNEMGVPRITSSIRLGTRVDKRQSIDDKIKSVEEKVGRGSLE